MFISPANITAHCHPALPLIYEYSKSVITFYSLDDYSKAFFFFPGVKAGKVVQELFAFRSIPIQQRGAENDPLYFTAISPRLKKQWGKEQRRDFTENDMLFLRLES